MASQQMLASISIPFNLPEGYMPKDKLNVPPYERNIRFGKTGKPIPATAVFRSVISRFGKKSTLAEKWIAVNERTWTMTFINTYNGKTGQGYDSEMFTFELDQNRLEHKRRGMVEVPVDKCPICVPANGDNGVTALLEDLQHSK